MKLYVTPIIEFYVSYATHYALISICASWREIRESFIRISVIIFVTPGFVVISTLNEYTDINIPRFSDAYYYAIYFCITVTRVNETNDILHQWTICFMSMLAIFL